jgi:hypothetical protein
MESIIAALTRDEREEVQQLAAVAKLHQVESDEIYRYLGETYFAELPGVNADQLERFSQIRLESFCKFRNPYKKPTLSQKQQLEANPDPKMDGRA